MCVKNSIKNSIYSFWSENVSCSFIVIMKKKKKKNLMTKLKDSAKNKRKNSIKNTVLLTLNVGIMQG